MARGTLLRKCRGPESEADCTTILLRQFVVQTIKITKVGPVQRHIDGRFPSFSLGMEQEGENANYGTRYP